MNGRAVRKLKRLRDMAPAEIAYRLRDQFRSGAERLRFHLYPAEEPQEQLAYLFAKSLACLRGESFLKGGLSFKRYLQEYPAQRFYLPALPEDRERLQQFVAHHFPAWKQAAIEEAERLCQHQVELLGYGRTDIGRKINWHRDPISEKIWPRRFWTDYDLVHDTTADPKAVHELNRHQHLPRLAKAYFLTGEERYAREAVDQITSWSKQNQPGLGINWHSSLEIGLRAISWMWTIFFLLPSESLDEDAARRIGSSLLTQLEHVYRHPSVYSSPNTHLIGEATALFLGGLLFSECDRALEWRRLGASLLVTEMDKQVSAEGVHVELSSYYHCYAVDFYLQALLLANHNRFSFPGNVSTKLDSMLGFIMHLTGPSGAIPLLGDDDGGRALALDQTSYRSFRDAFCTGAALFQRPEFKHQSGKFCEETLWMLGQSGWDRYATLRSHPPKELSASYPSEGYFIQRSSWDSRAKHLIFDCGGMGMLQGGHGHADALSLVLSAGGRELLVDPGTCLYNRSQEWRDFFRSTKAHNTVTVDSQNQSEPDGTFRWKRICRSRVLSQLSLGGIEYLEGEHDGYKHLSQEIIHRRRLLYCKPHYWVVVDDFRGKGEHTFDLHYHFSSDVRLRFGGSGRCVFGHELLAQVPGAGLQLFLRASAPLQAGLVCGQEAPIQGWISSRYGERKRAPVLRLRFSSKVPAAIVSVLVPFVTAPKEQGHWQRSQSLEVSELAAGAGAIACQVRDQTYEDLIAFSTQDSVLEVGDCTLHGELLWLHKDRGVLRQTFARNVRRVEYLGRTLFHHGTALDSVWKEFDAGAESSEGTELPDRGELGGIDYVRDLRDCAFRSV